MRRSARRCAGVRGIAPNAVGLPGIARNCAEFRPSVRWIKLAGKNKDESLEGERVRIWETSLLFRRERGKGG